MKANLSRRCVHLDFHMSHEIPGIGKHFFQQFILITVLFEQYQFLPGQILDIDAFPIRQRMAAAHAEHQFRIKQFHRLGRIRRQKIQQLHIFKEGFL